MAQKQQTLAEAAQENPEHRWSNLDSLLHWDYWRRTANKPAKGFLMESRMHGDTHVRFGESCDPFSRNLVSTKGMRGKGRRGL